MTISRNFDDFQYFNFETDFLETKKLFQKTGVLFFKLKALRLKTYHFHAKLPYPNPMFKQIEWWVQNEPITKNGLLPVTALFFRKLCFGLRNTYKELIWYNFDPNAHIPTFCKRWSFIWRCFFHMSIVRLAGVGNIKFAFTKFCFFYNFIILMK